jgi:hypothetical protein
VSVRSLRRGSIAASRVTAPATTNVLDLPGTSGNYASTPDSVANSITSDIDIVVKLSMDNWSAAKGFVAKWGGSGARSYRFGHAMAVANTLHFEFSEGGTGGLGDVSSVTHGFTNGTTHWVRAVWTNSDNLLKFYTSNDPTNDPAAVSWTQLGTNKTLPAAGIFNSTTDLVVGDYSSPGSIPFAGNIYVAEVRSTVGGAAVAKFDATAVTKVGTRNPSSVVASTGETWTVNGSAWDWAAI